MFKTLTAVLLSVSLALPAAAQSRTTSDTERAVGAVLGIAALALIAREISKSDKKKDKAPAPVFRPDPGPGHGGHRPDRGADRGPDRGGDWGGGRGPGRGHEARALPADCLLNVRDRRGEMTRILGKACVEREMRGRVRLPGACELTIRGRQQSFVGYEPRCLERSGYSIGHRR